VTPEDQHDGARATIREVMALVEQARRDALAEVKQLRTEVHAGFDTSAIQRAADRKAHEDEHEREENRRAGRLRWAVTTVMTGLGVLVAIVLGLWQGP
jgi:hypothetical protein